MNNAPHFGKMPSSKVCRLSIITRQINLGAQSSCRYWIVYCGSSFLRSAWSILLVFTLSLAIADPAERLRDWVPVLTMKIKGHTDWKPIVVDLRSTSRPGSVRVNARTSTYEGMLFGRSDNTMPIEVILFETPNGNLWVGPKRDFYIETETGVVGGAFDWIPFRGIIWSGSLVKGKNDPKDTIDEIAVRVGRELLPGAFNTLH